MLNGFQGGTAVDEGVEKAEGLSEVRMPVCMCVCVYSSGLSRVNGSCVSPVCVRAERYVRKLKSTICCLIDFDKSPNGSTATWATWGAAWVGSSSSSSNSTMAASYPFPLWHNGRTMRGTRVLCECVCGCLLLPLPLSIAKSWLKKAPCHAWVFRLLLLMLFCVFVYHYCWCWCSLLHCCSFLVAGRSAAVCRLRDTNQTYPTKYFISTFSHAPPMNFKDMQEQVLTLRQSTHAS